MPLTWHNIAAGGVGDWQNSSYTSTMLFTIHATAATSSGLAAGHSETTSRYEETTFASGVSRSDLEQESYSSSYQDTYAFGNTGSNSADRRELTLIDNNNSKTSMLQETSYTAAGANSIFDSDGVLAGQHYTQSSLSRNLDLGTTITGASGISWTRTAVTTYQSHYGYTITERTGAGTDTGVTVTVTAYDFDSVTSTISSSSITYSAPRGTATTGWGTTTSGVGYQETTTAVTDTSEQITATRITTTAGTVTGSYWTTQYASVTVTQTVFTVDTVVGTVLTAQTTTYDLATQHLQTVISRTSPSEWLFFFSSLWGGTASFTQVAATFDITTSLAAPDTTITRTLRAVTDTSSATRTVTGYGVTASTITRTTATNVTTTKANWTGGFPMSTATQFRSLVTTATGTLGAAVTTSATATFYPAGNLETVTVTAFYSPLTTRAAYTHTPAGGSATFAEPVQVASTYTRLSYQQIVGPTSSWTSFSTSSAISTYGGNSGGQVVGYTELQTAVSRFSQVSSATPACTPYQTIARGHGWQAGISAGPFDAMGTQITADRTIFLGGIVEIFAAASPSCLQERNYSASTVSSQTSISASVGIDGSWRATTVKRTTLFSGTASYTASTGYETFTISLGLAGAGDQFDLGSAGYVGVVDASFTGIAAGHPRFSGESTLVSFAPGVYQATGLDTAGVSATASTVVAMPGTTAAYAATAVAVEPGVLTVSNALSTLAAGARSQLVTSYFDPES